MMNNLVILDNFKVKMISPEMKIIALVDDVETKEVAESLNIDDLVFKGIRVEKLKNNLTSCIQENIEEVDKSNFWLM